MTSFRKGRSSTTALLEKATSQLHGERVRVDNEQDDIKVYINSLTNRTSKQQKSISFDVDSDISISNEDYNFASSPAAAPVVSKFLKKKPADKAGETSSGNRTITTTQAAKNYKSYAPLSNAVTKADNLTEKISSRAKNFTVTPMSSMSISDMESESSVGESKGRGHRRSVRPMTRRPVSALSDESEAVGRDGGRFLKGNVTNQDQVENDVIEVEPEREVVQAATKPMKPSTTFQLSSDEESLAEFIGHLTDSESHDIKVTNKHRSPSPKSYSSTDDFKGNVVLDLDSLGPVMDAQTPKPKAAPSPFYKQNNVSNNDPSFHAKYKSSVSQIPDKSPFYKNTEKLHDDEPDFVRKGKPSSPFLQSQTKSPFYTDEKNNETGKSTKSPFFTKPDNKTASKSPFAAKKAAVKFKTEKYDKKLTTPSDVFSAFGLQTVDDLLGGNSERESDTEIDKSRNVSMDESISVVRSRFSSTSVPERVVSYTEDFEDSITERLGNARRDADQVRSVVDTDTSSSQSSSSDSTDSSASHDVSRSDAHSPQSHVVASQTNVAVETRAIQVQTDREVGFHYSWDTRFPQSIGGPRFGLDSVDHTPIAAHVVSADAIEAVTAYTPATIALHNMLKDQLHLTTQFLAVQQSLYQAYTRDANTSSYQYTTLEDTKRYIAAHRKPRLTFEEALKMVAAENM